ncbi:MAG: LysR family transcriptional regulator [Bacteroidota bacterium]
MNYTLHQLQVFVKIAKTASITKAAEELNLSQPAVSIQLKNFQEQFDVPLTEIIGRKIYITHFGKEIAIAGKKIIDEVNAIEYKTSLFKGKTTGKLKIAVVSTGKYVMPYFLTDFLNQNQEIELLLDVTNRAKAIDALSRNETDFSLVSVLPDKLNIEKEELLQNKLYLVGNAEWAAKFKGKSKEVLTTINLIYREEGSGVRLTLQQYLDNNNLKVKKKLELTSNEAVKQAVIAGLGCSVMPLIGLKNELQNGDLFIIPIKGFPIKTSWNLIWLKQKSLSPVALAFLNFIKSNKESIIKNHFEWYETYR